MTPLKDLMDKTTRFTSPAPAPTCGSAIKGIGRRQMFGERNIPDGECFSCPVRDSVNGVIQFNCETLYRGTVFNGIKLTFKNGKVVDATAAGRVDKLNEILDSDEGARYVGEWSLGFNPHVRKPMKDILFDEKIAGSFHLTPGQAYEEAGTATRARCIGTWSASNAPITAAARSGSDGRTIRKDGLFVLDELVGLNPDRLGA
jgi:aminopeptidase